MSEPAVKQIVLASRPKGPPTAENFRLETVPMPALPTGGLLLRVLSPLVGVFAALAERIGLLGASAALGGLKTDMTAAATASTHFGTVLKGVIVGAVGAVGTAAPIVGFVVGRAVGPSVVRHRVSRRLRAQTRLGQVGAMAI